jgi:hypothetical protein
MGAYRAQDMARERQRPPLDQSLLGPAALLLAAFLRNPKF